MKKDAYAALRIPDYRRFLCMRLMTTLTVQIMSVSVGYYVYELTNDPLMLGFIGLAEALRGSGSEADRGRAHNSCDSEYLTIQADEEMIEQVLINLMKNSIEALGEIPSGRIDITGKYSGTSVIIEVIDNGSGIIKEALNRVFVPFFTTKKTGSGIGLSLSRQIMQMHNGSLSVESEPGIRTIFSLKF